MEILNVENLKIIYIFISIIFLIKAVIITIIIFKYFENNKLLKEIFNNQNSIIELLVEIKNKKDYNHRND